MQENKTKRRTEKKRFPVRDPLYGFIELTDQERQLLNSRALQRLTRIKQLGHTYIVYPSAVHNRFEHSLGTMHVACRIGEQIGLSLKDIKVVRIGGLLHDIGHGPFSHVFEQVIDAIAGENFSHTNITSLIAETDKELRQNLKDLSKDVLEILNFQEKNAKCEILSGPLDADRLDYLRRDSYHTGVAYGVFDFERIVRNLCVINDGERDYIGIHEKGVDALESYRMARHNMHTQVYEHHTRLIAEDMFVRAIKYALDEAVLDRDALNPKKDINKFLSYYLSLDDGFIQHLLLTQSKGKARKIIQDLRRRQLLKRAYIIPMSGEAIPDYIKRMKLQEMKKEQADKLEQEIASKAGLEPDQLVLHLQSTEIKLYENLEGLSSSEEERILVKCYNGLIKHISEVSPFKATPVRKRLYIFCPDKEIERVSRIAEDIIGVENQYSPQQKRTAK